MERAGKAGGRRGGGLPEGRQVLGAVQVGAQAFGDGLDLLLNHRAVPGQEVVQALEPSGQLLEVGRIDSDELPHEVSPSVRLRGELPALRLLHTGDQMGLFLEDGIERR